MELCSAKGATEVSPRNAEGKGEERKGGSEDRTRVRKRGLRLRGVKGDVFDVVYYIQGMLYTVGHEATIPIESEGPCMHPGVCVHPPGSSLGSECFRELQSSSDAISDAESNVARIGTLQRTWVEKQALSTANEASYHQDKQSELEQSVHKPL